MKAKLDALPSWPEDEMCDDSWHSPHWYKLLLKESPGEDDDD